jgi:hypothetical protein
MPTELPEPWLRGPLADVHPLLAPTLHAYAQAREDIAHWTKDLAEAEIWSQADTSIASVGFHMRHIAGSVERLTAYVAGRQLTPGQLSAIPQESTPGATRSELLAAVNHALDQSEEAIRSLNVADLSNPRVVGRKQLPTTVVGLVVHLAEHTQRHVGALIVTTKLVRLGRTRPTAS